MNKGKPTWNFEKDKMLIELVKSKPGLYNLQSPYYSDNNYKKMVWDEIGKAVGRQVVKTHWEKQTKNKRVDQQLQELANGDTTIRCYF